MPQQSLDPDWVTPGSQVIMVSANGARVGQIKRLTSTLIVLEDDTRFNRRTLSRKIDEWRSVRLHSADDPVALGKLARTKEEQARQAVRGKFDAFTAGPSEDTAVAVEQALGVWRKARAHADNYDNHG